MACVQDALARVGNVVQAIVIHIAVVEQLEAEVYAVVGMGEAVGSVLIGIAAGTDSQSLVLEFSRVRAHLCSYWWRADLRTSRWRWWLGRLFMR